MNDVYNELAIDLVENIPDMTKFLADKIVKHLESIGALDYDCLKEIFEDDD
jgi:ERCC4-type nuclease